MMKRSIRGRLILLIAALLLPLSGVAGWLLVQLFGNRLLHDIDTSLGEEVDTLAAVLAKPSPSGLAADVWKRIASENDLGGRKYIVVTQNDRVIAEAPTGAQHVIAAGAPSLRVVRAQVNTADGPTIIAIGLHATAALRAKRRLTLLLSFGMPLTLMLTLAGLWGVLGHTLRPLEDASRRIESIAVDNLSARLPIANREDEVGRMVVVLNRMLERLESAVRELHRFSADAAHELRTPLAVLRTGLEVALAQERSAAEYREALVEALAATERVGRLAENLLTLARLEQLDRVRSVVPVELREMFEELADAWLLVAERRGVQLQVSAEPGLIVSGNPSELYRLFNNLVENALRHSPSGGRIELSGQPSAEGVEGAVRDHGPGIAAEDVPRAFDRFYRGDDARTYAGAGLGLSIAQEIARTHGGRITLSNAPGGGCVARVILPRAA